MSTKVFVYGTLRKGHGNHRLLKNSPFLGYALTAKNYTMYVTGIPYVTSKQETCRIVGEVYEVDVFTLHALDQLEGHPRFYRREEIQATLIGNGTVSCYLYFNDSPPRCSNKVVNGDYVNPEFEEVCNVQGDFRRTDWGRSGCVGYSNRTWN